MHIVTGQMVTISENVDNNVISVSNSASNSSDDDEYIINEEEGSSNSPSPLPCSTARLLSQVNHRSSKSRRTPSRSYSPIKPAMCSSSFKAQQLINDSQQLETNNIDAHLPNLLLSQHTPEKIVRISTETFMSDSSAVTANDETQFGESLWEKTLMHKIKLIKEKAKSGGDRVYHAFAELNGGKHLPGTATAAAHPPHNGN